MRSLQWYKRGAAYLGKRINAEPLTYHEARSSLKTSAGLQWWPKQGVRNDLGVSKNTGWREVKSSEECIATLHPCKPLMYSWLCRICEEWRVFLKVALYSLNSAKLLRKMWEIGQKLLRKMCKKELPFCSSLGRQSVLTDGLWCPSEEQTTTTR